MYICKYTLEKSERVNKNEESIDKGNIGSWLRTKTSEIKKNKQTRKTKRWARTP